MTRADPPPPGTDAFFASFHRRVNRIERNEFVNQPDRSVRARASSSVFQIRMDESLDRSRTKEYAIEGSIKFGGIVGAIK